MELTGRRFGHIRVTGVVGQGGMGDVYSGYDEKLERKVALKVLHAEQRLDHSARERLLREARALSKLDHAHICRIHDYVESDDVDVLVLEYIDGTTLGDVFKEKVTRGEKLRIAIAVAEVLVAAHRAGIIHRDLKPENVMLTKSREVKVLDFGLARWLQLARALSSDRLRAVQGTVVPIAQGRTDTLPMPDESSPHATAAGITLGTPLFMSPEQARGETLTPASDMFSFGLLLQTLFTGEDPYPDDLTSREVMLRAARGETNPVSGIERDVTTLINRLKQFAPADRPTAIEAVERLTFLQNKPQRIARRAVAALVVTLMAMGGWCYAIDLQRERSIALAAQNEAEKRRAQAEDLINFMVGDLRTKLEPVGRLDVLDDVARKTLQYVSSSEPGAMTAGELARNAKVLHQVGEVNIAQGKLDDAMRAFGQSVTLSSAAAKRAPRDPVVRLSLGTSHFWLGNGYRLQGNLPKARRHLTEYMNVAEQLAREYPENDEYRLERAYGHSNVAMILEAQGQYREALVHHSVTRAIKSERLAADPSNAEKQADVAMTLNKMGFVLQRLGDLRGALESFERELMMYRLLARSDPSHSRWKERVAVSHSYAASAREALGDYDAAFALREQELAANRELHTRDPQNAEWQRNLAVSLWRRGNLLRIRGAHEAALTDYAAAEALVEPLIRRDPTRRSWQRDRAVIRVGHARTLLASGHADEARRMAADAASALQSLSSLDTILPRYVADAQLVLGDASAAAGDRPAAQRAWLRAHDALRDTARSTTDLETLDTWAQVLLRLGRDAEATPVAARLRDAGYVQVSDRTAVPRRPS